jgi:hypothetical protein
MCAEVQDSMQYYEAGCHKHSLKLSILTSTVDIRIEGASPSRVCSLNEEQQNEVVVGSKELFGARAVSQDFK